MDKVQLYPVSKIQVKLTAAHFQCAYRAYLIKCIHDKFGSIMYNGVEKMSHTSTTFMGAKGQEMLVLGDFNIDLLPKRKTGMASKVVQMCNILQLKQIIDQPTRITENTKTLIDHIYCTRPECIVDKRALLCGLSDH